MKRIWTQFKRKTAPLRRAIRYRNRKPQRDVCDVADSIVLASSGRSGSTFLAGLLNWDNEFRFLFEPMHPQWVKEFRAYPKHPYLPENSNNSPLAKTVCDSLSGSISNPWIDQFNAQKRPRRRLVKTIRGNLALAGFSAAAPDTRIIFLIRNPLAQALSVVRGHWNLDPSSLYQQSEFNERYPELCRYLKQCPADPFLRAMTFWCVENFVPLNELNLSKVLCVRYENILTNPRTELSRLFAYIEKEFDDQVLQQVDVRSKTSRPTDKGTPLDRWRTQLTSLQQRQAREILATFDLHGLYDDEGKPSGSVAEAQNKLRANPLAMLVNSPHLAGAKSL